MKTFEKILVFISCLVFLVLLPFYMGRSYEAHSHIGELNYQAHMNGMCLELLKHEREMK
jgi:hypothetical protein